MTQQEQIDYDRIAKAIDFIKNNFKEQPTLKEIAASIHLSPHHFQRLFTNWAGVSPKKFTQYLSIDYAKSLLQKDKATLSMTAHETGFSGTGRLHDLFVNLEGMTPGEFKNQGKNLVINYSFAECPFGNVIVASTKIGICHMAFFDHAETALLKLKESFPKASYRQVVDTHQQNALFIFRHDWDQLNEIKLHLVGSSFQLKVWEALLRIPMGRLSTYGSIANEIGKPKAARAVGTAIGSNPVAFLIPCHRVIQSSGNIGGYMWGPTRKSAIIGWEASRANG